MIRRQTLTLLCGLLAGFACAGAMAQERGNRDEAKAMADAAVEHVKKVGPEQAWKDFTTGKDWKKKDLYVFAMDMKANMLAHGANDKLLGKNVIELKDANGKPMIAEMVKVASTSGAGWVDYDWPNPVTKKIEPKSTYTRKLATFDGLIGVGAYR
jgi:signal transduction histidine kinase